MTAMEKRLIPSDFNDDWIFYLHVDPLAITHELPSLFYRKYRPLLGERMIVMDLNSTQIELSLCKGNSSSYIVHGFENLVNCFGLSSGGWIKIMYVGEDVFVVMKVKDSFMATKELSYPSPKLASNYYHLTHESTSREVPVGFCQPIISNPIHQENATKKLSTQNSHTQGPCQYHIPTTPQAGSFGYPTEIETISKETYCLDYSQKHVYLNQPPLPDETLKNAELMNGSVILPTKILSNLSQAQTSPLPVGYVSLEEKVILNNPTSPLVKRQRSFPQNANESNIPPPVMPAPVIPAMRTYRMYTCMKLLTSNQVDNSSLILPLRFAQNAFPSRYNNVKVILDNGCCYQLGLRWNKSRKGQLYLTRGWKSLARTNGFRSGTVLKFHVSPADETTMHVQVLKL